MKAFLFYRYDPACLACEITSGLEHSLSICLVCDFNTPILVSLGSFLFKGFQQHIDRVQAL